MARKLKEKNPAIIVVAVDPKGSILAEPDALNDEKRLQSYVVEGIGYDFIPAVLVRGNMMLRIRLNMLGMISECYGLHAQSSAIITSSSTPFPTAQDRSIVDSWVKTDDAESLIMSRRMIREEGLLCGE